MKKLTILFLAVCIIAVGCKNKVTNNVDMNANDNMRAMKTIEEEGGTPDSSPEGIASFLGEADYNGVFATEAGFVGYKVKDSKIYYVDKVGPTNEQEASQEKNTKEVWVEITEGISVDKTLNKLEYQTANGLEILTFDGFGYRYYSKGEDRVIYYKKTDYLEPYAGIWKNENYEIEIASDGCFKRRSKFKGSWYFGRYTTQVVLEGNTLTLKGVDRSVMIFEQDAKGNPTGKATYRNRGGDAVELQKNNY